MSCGDSWDNHFRERSPQSYWENANAADTDDATDVTAGDLKMLEVNNFGARASDWDVGNDGQYPALKHDGSLICGQPSPRAYCEPPVQIASATAVTEGGTAMFTLTRWATFEDRATALTVTVSVTGGAGFIGTPSPNVMFAATSREATYSVPTEGDTMDEADGRITVTITDATTDYSVEQGQGSATAEVMDDDLPVVSITGGASVIEGEAAEFTVTRVGNTTEALTVMVDVTQTGDFLTSTTSPVSVEILADQATATLSVDTEDDDGDEPDGMITATMPVSASTYRLGTATATVDVMDNDVVPPAPADLTAPSTDTTSVSLTWTAVAADPPVTGYQVKVSDGAGTTVITDWDGHSGKHCGDGEPHRHWAHGLDRLHLYDPRPERCGRRRGGDRRSHHPGAPGSSHSLDGRHSDLHHRAVDLDGGDNRRGCYRIPIQGEQRCWNCGHHGLDGYHEQRCHNVELHGHGTYGRDRVHLCHPRPEQCGGKRRGDGDRHHRCGPDHSSDRPFRPPGPCGRDNLDQRRTHLDGCGD